MENGADLEAIVEEIKAAPSNIQGPVIKKVKQKKQANKAAVNDLAETIKSIAAQEESSSSV